MIDELKCTNEQHPMTRKLIHDGQYSAETRMTCVKLCAVYHVSQENVGRVIQVVCQQLFNVRVTKLPSSSTLSSWIQEWRSIALKQAAEVMASKDCIIHFDETSKFGKKYSSFQV